MVILADNVSTFFLRKDQVCFFGKIFHEYISNKQVFIFLINKCTALKKFPGKQEKMSKIE